MTVQTDLVDALDQTDRALDTTHKARLTVVETVYHQHPTWESTIEEQRYGVWLESLEIPYRRPLLIGERWVSLDCGWLGDGDVEDIGMVLLSNPNPVYQHIPSREQSITEEEKVIEIGWLSCHTPTVVPTAPDDPRGVTAIHGPEVIALLRRGRSFRLEPHNPNRLYLRCSKGSTVCNVLVIPK